MCLLRVKDCGLQEMVDPSYCEDRKTTLTSTRVFYLQLSAHKAEGMEVLAEMYRQVLSDQS